MFHFFIFREKVEKEIEEDGCYLSFLSSIRESEGGELFIPEIFPQRIVTPSKGPC